MLTSVLKIIFEEENIKNRISNFFPQLLISSDLIVITGCTLLYGIPDSELWENYEFYVFPILGPYIMPITQISLMISVYCTTLMSFERYTRIGRRCQMKNCSYVTENNLK